MSETAASGLPASSNASPEAETEAESEQRLIYKLEVVQSPSRGRTCGFGDADRRALSAPLIARLRLFRQVGNSEVELDANEIDITFLICAADLWDADQSREMNLVQHPSYHYKPSPVPAPARLPWQDSQSTSSSSATTAGLPMAQYPTGRRSSNASHESVGERDQLPPEAGENWALSPTSRSRRPSSGAAYPQSQDDLQNHNERRSPASTAELRLPPIVSSPSHSWRQLPPTSQRRMSTSQTSPTTTTFAFQAPGPSSFPPSMAGEGTALLNRQVSSNSTLSAPRTSSSSGRRPWTALTNRPSTSATSHSIHAAAAPSNRGNPDLTDIACVKNLVGALTTNAHRLRAPMESTDGVWFVFHDLSVRTEGMFSIRLRLASIGSLVTGMAQGQMSIMAEVFTPPFEVMSAKKFPGMLDPTPLSQAFARQGLRIPTRRGANRKRRRTDALAPSEGLDGETTPVPEEEGDLSS